MKEYIKVFIRYDQSGRTACICLRKNKACLRTDKKCSPEIVERDPYRGWEDLFKVDKYGKSKGG